MHPFTSGWFLEARLCVFQRKDRLKQTDDGLSDFCLCLRDESTGK